MNFYERITNIIFPHEFLFDGDYYRGKTIMNQPQLLGKHILWTIYYCFSAIQSLSTNWHEDILCLFGVNLAKLEQFVQDQGEFEINYIDNSKFHGPKWTSLPGAYIRNKLGEINEEFVNEGQNLLIWCQEEHTHSELGINIF